MSKRTIDAAKSAAGPASTANTKATYPTGPAPGWKEKQSVAHGDTGPASVRPPDPNKR
jgi:hypothetical protein